MNLFDGYLDARDCFSGEGLNFAGLVADDAVFMGMYGEVAAHLGAWAGALGHADLADDNLSGFDFLAAIKLDA